MDLSEILLQMYMVSHHKSKAWIDFFGCDLRCLGIICQKQAFLDPATQSGEVLYVTLRKVVCPSVCSSATVSR